MSTPPSPLEFSPTGEFSPPRSHFEGVHFSDSDVKDGVLHGARRGSSPEASDAHRVRLGGGAPPGVHLYRAGAVAHRAIAGRKYAHKVSGQFAVANIDGAQRDDWANALTTSYKQYVVGGVDPKTAKSLAQNDAERSLQAAGWDGYEASKHQPGSVFLFGDVKTDSAKV